MHRIITAEFVPWTGWSNRQDGSTASDTASPNQHSIGICTTCTSDRITSRTLAILLEDKLALLVVLVLPATPILTTLACSSEKYPQSRRAAASRRHPPLGKKHCSDLEFFTHPCS